MTVAIERSSGMVYGRALLFLAGAFVLVAAWIALSAALPDGPAANLRLTVVRVVIHATLLYGLWQAVTRSSIEPAARVRVWLAIAVPFTAWLALVWGLAVGDVFRPRPGVPALPLAIFLPIIIGLVALLRSRRIGDLLDATPPSWLVGVQWYRIFGAIFLAGWFRGDLPGAFALPAGIGDVLVGVLALPVAALVHAGAPGSRRAAIAWNVLGIVDLTVAVALGTLSAPGPLQLIAPDRPSVALGAFPTVMIPAFAVPSSILLHALSLRQLLRAR